MKCARGYNFCPRLSFVDKEVEGYINVKKRVVSLMIIGFSFSNVSICNTVEECIVEECK